LNFLRIVSKCEILRIKERVGWHQEEKIGDSLRSRAPRKPNMGCA